MLTNISWSSYITAISVLLLIWYFIVILKFYGKDLKKIFSGEKVIKIPIFRKDVDESDPLEKSFTEPFDTLEDAKELSSRLLQAIDESVEMSRSKQELQNYVKMILEEYPYVKISSLRDNINKIIVSKCEKHPQFILSYAEADGLWEETI